MYTTAENRREPPTDHVLLSVPGVAAETFAIDILHVVDLGITLHAVGNLFFDLVFHVFPGTREAATTRLFNEVLAGYVDLGVGASHRVTRILLTNFCDKDAPHKSFPCLSGIKAREARWLLPVAASLADTYSSGSNYNAHRAHCLKNLSAACQTLDTNGPFLTPCGRPALRTAINNLSLQYS